VVAGLAIGGLISSAIGGEDNEGPASPSESSSSSAPQPAATEEATTDPIDSEAPQSKGTCLGISDRLFEAINSGVQDIQESNSILKASAYKAPDRANVWFIAAEIQGPGIGSGVAIGVWASSYGVEDDGTGSLFSVDGIANEFSSWGSTEGTSFEISRFEDGVQESRDCLN
jgi:hypothetical protein